MGDVLTTVATWRGRSRRGIGQDGRAVLETVLGLGNRLVPVPSAFNTLTCGYVYLPPVPDHSFRLVFGFLNRASQVRILPWAPAKHPKG